VSAKSLRRWTFCRRRPYRADVLSGFIGNAVAPMLVIAVVVIAWQIATRVRQEELKIRRFLRDQAFLRESAEHTPDDRDTHAVAG
jgi:hypothetical protein